MAASCDVSVIAEVTGLGKLLQFAEKFAVTTAPTAVTYNYRTQVTTDTNEALDLGDVTTVHLIVIKAVSKGLSIDTSWVTTFVEEIYVQEGEIAVFKPGGTVYIKNHTASDVCTYEYILVGVT